jgi:hypothetical protein
MNRRTGGKKQGRAKAAKRPARPRNKAVSSKAPIVLGGDASEYVGRLASAIAEVTAAQDLWLSEIDLASRMPAVTRDPQWQARSQAAVKSLLVAANGLRIEPVPETMIAVDNTLGRAQEEAQLATDGYVAAVEEMDTASMLAIVRRVDRMGQFIQQAYALVRG